MVHTAEKGYDGAKERGMKMEQILKVEHLEKYYGTRGNITKAVDDISFEVRKGEFLGIMGASGSGKTTLLNCLSTIDAATSGHIFLEGTDITALKSKQLSQFRRTKLGFIFQDHFPLPRMKTSRWRSAKPSGKRLCISASSSLWSCYSTRFPFLS
jgi:ABC-type oligopeptide transport system ATPase subunit